jgi:peroxiredoxin
MKHVKKIAVSLVVLAAVVGVFVLIANGSKKNEQIISNAPRENTVAPDFSLPSTDGSTVTLSDFTGKKNVLIYFHEGLTCDPCMQQMPELDKYQAEFDKFNVQLLHVALDSPDDLRASAARYNLKSPVLSYQDATTEEDYVLLPYSMGMGRRAGHTFVLVGTDGLIKWRKDYWPSLGMSVSDGTMFVQGSEIVAETEKALNNEEATASYD